MEKDRDHANVTLIISENGNYSTIKEEVYLKSDNHIRFLDLLNNPNLVSKYTGVYLKNQITVGKENRKHEIETSDIVIAYEKKDKRGNDDERKRMNKLLLNNPLFREENISLSTKDHKYKINGTVIGLKQKINGKEKFIAFTDVKLEGLVEDEAPEHAFVAINPEYFDIPVKYK